MSKKIKNEQKKFLGETLNQYDKALDEAINQLDKKNREQNHKISSLVNSFDNEYLEKDVEGNMTTLENSKDGMVIINEIQGSTEVNYCKDGEKELILNGDIDTQGESFVTITEGVDGGLVDVSLEGNTEINLSKTKDPVLVTREFDDINCNTGKLQYTIDDVTTINDEPGKVDIDRIVGDTMVNHAVNGSEELILNAHINESGDNNITLNGVTSDGGKVDVALEGNTLVNVSNVKDDYITPSIEDKVDQGSVISLPEVSEGFIHIDEIEGNTMVNYCTDGAKELTLNGDIDTQGESFVTLTEGVDSGLVDVSLEGNTLVNLKLNKYYNCEVSCGGDKSTYVRTDEASPILLKGEILQSSQENNNTWQYLSFGKINMDLLKTNATYTLIIKDEYKTTNKVFIQNGEASQSFSVNSSVTSKYVGNYNYVTLKTKNDFTGLNPSSIILYGNLPNTYSGKFDISIIGLFEGDWTDKEIPQYFEGMKSVGQDDVNGHKVEIISQNKNLFDGVVSSEFSNPEYFNVSSNGVLSSNMTNDGRPWNYDNTQYRMKLKKGDYTITLETITPSTRDYSQTLVYKKGVTDSLCLFRYQVMTTVGVYSQQFSLDEDADIGIESKIVDGTFRIQIEKGSQSTAFTPHQSNKKEIPLNEPLRSLPNGTKDRFVKIGGKWFIERNCEEIVVDGSYDWKINGNGTIYYSTVNFIGSKYVLPTVNSKMGNIVCDKRIVTHIDYIYTKEPNSVIGYIGLSKDGNLGMSLDNKTPEQIKEELTSNPMRVILQLKTPVYEPLEIEPTLNTYNDVTHISNNSIIPCNMKIQNTGYNAIIKPSTLYTIAVDTNKNGTIGINLGGAEVTTTNNVATITTPATLTDDSLRLYGKGIKGSKVRLLEGDKTNWIPSFFEGMKSSFEDKVQDDGSYRMEVLMNNVNLLDIQNISFKNTADYTLENNKIIINSSKKYQAVYYYIPVKRGITYTICCKNITGGTLILLYRGKITGHVVEKYLGSIYDTSLKKRVIADEDYITIRVSNENSINTECIFEDILFYEGTEEIEYIPNKSNKIQLSSLEPLRGVGDVHDRLVFKDGKLMIERNYASVTLNGGDDENYTVWVNPNKKPTQNVFILDYSRDILKNIAIKSDGYNAVSYIIDNFNKDAVSKTGFVCQFYNNMHLGLPKACLENEDNLNIKQWLQQHPTTVVYQLAEPVYEEIPDDLQKIILESYTNGTLFFDTNIPPTKVSFNCFEEELTYLYPATSYTVQFNSDRDTTVDVTLGGTQLLSQDIIRGTNRISITTPDTLVDNKLIIDGTGANIREIVVSDTDREFDYFEGMKSVGECEELEVVSCNKNLFDINGEYKNERNLNVEITGSQIKISNPTIGYSRIDYIIPTHKVPTSLNLSFDIVDSNAKYFVYLGLLDENKQELVFKSSVQKDVDVYMPKDVINPVRHKVKYFMVSLEPAFVSTSNITGDEYVIFDNIQLEEGSGATTYVQAQSNKKEILLTEPLRGIGEIKDKYVLLDGKWYIERKCEEVVLDGSIPANVVPNCTALNHTVFQFTLKSNAIAKGGVLLHKSDVIKPQAPGWSNLLSQEIEVTHVYNDSCYIKIANTRLSNISTSNMITWLSNNPVRIVYGLKQPTYEPIDYNPFEVYNEVTHISTNSTIPCNVTVKNHGYNLVALKENTQYTLYVNKDTTNALTYRLGDYVEINSLSKFTFTTPSTLTDKTLRIDGKGAKVNDLMLIEGTPTNDSIGYFDGLKSSYECEQVTDENDVNYGKYKVDIKVVGKNKIPYWEIGDIYNDAGVEYYNEIVLRTGFIRLCAGKTYVFTDRGISDEYWFGVITYDLNKKYTGNLAIPTGGHYFTVERDMFIKIKKYNPNKETTWTPQLEEGTQPTEYEPYFESKQTIYLNSPLLKGDEIVWKDNKIQHYHKMKTVVFDGSDDETFGKAYNTNSFYTAVNNMIKSNNYINKIYSDKLITTTSYNDFKTPDIFGISGYTVLEGYPSENWIYIRVPNIETVAEIRQWLQQNHLTVVYELATPYYEEISDYPLKLNVIANSSLSTESTIQVTNISFNIYEETLPYLYPNTKYYITFNADVDRNNIIINLGGSHVVLDCKVGFNKVEITTPNDTTNLLTFSGTGVNINHVKVTQQDIDEYFEGMKSVGECEELVITSANSDNTLLNTQQLTHEPLRGAEEVRDRYVMIDGKWFIERNCKEVVLDGSDDENYSYHSAENNIFYRIDTVRCKGSLAVPNISDKIYDTRNYAIMTTTEMTMYHNSSALIIHLTNDLNNIEKFRAYLSKNPLRVILALETPVYEEIDYNPFETYADITHITANSLIPTNVVVKNHGYNCILKPSTKYTIALNKPNGTISAKLGGSAKVDSTNSIFTITTPSTLNDNVLRLSGSGNVKDIMILEGDKTVNTPSYFEGIESVFEQEYDTEKGKYRVTARVEGNGKESSIVFYINEPLRGTGIAKDKVFIQDGKVIVQRNCGSVTLDGRTSTEYNYHAVETSNTNSNCDKLIINSCDYFNKYKNGLADKLPFYTYGHKREETYIYPSEGVKHFYIVAKKSLGLDTKEKFLQWLQQNPITIIYQLAEPVYEEADCDLSKLVLENYENSSLIFESNIPVSANIKYSGEVPVVTQAKTLSSKVDNTTLDINENIIPYMCDIDYRIVELQLMNGDTQGEGIELLGIGDIEILGNENVLFNNREDKKHNYSYDMLKRDILSQRYSKEEYRYRLDRYLLANKISDEEYKELEGLLNNGE